MAVFYIGSYDIIDPQEFQKYPPIVMALLPRYGGEVLASDTSGQLVEGSMRTMKSVIQTLAQISPSMASSSLIRDSGLPW